jgi:hypothetical protein
MGSSGLLFSEQSSKPSPNTHSLSLLRRNFLDEPTLHG